MKKIDILIAHPYKHHVYHLAAGCQRSGWNTKLVVPLYRVGLGRCLASLPGRIGSKARGYYYEELEPNTIVSPLAWQARKLASLSSHSASFESKFDNYVARQIRDGEFKPKVLVTMQDYMPRVSRPPSRQE
ncbi:hypothetical protein [Cupriavidus basilensis]|uniref:hypothetical protein n=1 Tax=Cupriavidus basilensis TaxID=68895 RepID=UPI0039F67B10